MKALALLLLVIVSAPGACGTSTDSNAETTTARAADPSVTTLTPSSVGSPGTVTVTMGDDRLSFVTDICAIAEDGLHVEAHGVAGTLTILHASPPTGRPPEPSFAVFVIEGERRYEAPPAAVQLDAYDPAAGIATGEALDVAVGGDPTATHTASFTIECPPNV